MEGLILGDCLEVMRDLADCSVDAVITDPPYGINFMGKAWDGKAIEQAAAREAGRDFSNVTRLTGGAVSSNRKETQRTASGFANRAGEAGAYDFSLRGNYAFQQWCSQWGAECLRVLKPGGHILCFGGTRTYHRMAAGLEDAGFEIRDCLAWMFGSGFPKSHDVSKGIDKAAGKAEERGYIPTTGGLHGGSGHTVGRFTGRQLSDESVTAAAAAAAAEGWGTALKPAFEPIVLARKPFTGTVADNFQRHGAGALNIDATRIKFASDGDQAAAAAARLTVDQNAVRNAYGSFPNGPASLEPYLAGMDKGRWPANVLLDELSAELLNEQSGQSSSSPSSSMPIGHAFAGPTYGEPKGRTETETMRGFNDFGGASRFFYVAKVSRAERSAGCERLPKQPRGEDVLKNNGGIRPPDPPVSNFHPTVKPIALMRYLARLITPKGGLILDPFLGSGTTAIAAHLEGFRFVGIEREQGYMRIAQARIAFWQEHGEDGLRICAERDAAERTHAERVRLGQLTLV